MKIDNKYAVHYGEFIKIFIIDINWKEVFNVIL